MASRSSPSSPPCTHLSMDVDPEDLISIENSVSLEGLSRESILAGAKNVFSAEPSLLPGEIIVAKCPNLISKNPFQPSDFRECVGTLFVSNFKLSFIPQEQSSYLIQDSPSYQPEIDTPHTCELPLSTIAQVAVCALGKRRELVRRQPVSGAIEEVEILAKDFRRLTYGTQHAVRSAVDGCLNAILFYGFPSNIMQLFFFDSARVIAKRNRKRPSGSGLFDSFDDWNRDLSRLNATRWRVTDANAEYKVSETLPSYFCVPIGLSDVQVLNVAASHKLCRLPVWAWSHPDTGVSLATSSVILPGISKPDKSIEVAMSGMTDVKSTYSQVQILDLDETCSPRSELDASFTKLRQLHTPSSVKEMEANDASYLSNLEATGWLKHVKTALLVASEVTRVLFDSKYSVIIEEQEGRDLTCLISSLVQLLADPYYRSIAGFQMLIQKCWIASGHPFFVRVSACSRDEQSFNSSLQAAPASTSILPRRKHHRSPSLHSSKSASCNMDESSVFLLFLDCVWQLLQQFPATFQFSTFYLEQLWQQVFSAQHCSFTFSGYHHLASILDTNGDVALIRSDLVPVWDVLKLRPLSEKLCYFNPLYRLAHSKTPQSHAASPVDRMPLGKQLSDFSSLSLVSQQQTHDMTACGHFPVKHGQRQQQQQRSYPAPASPLQPSVVQCSMKLWSDRYEKYTALAGQASRSYATTIQQIDLVHNALDHHMQVRSQQQQPLSPHRPWAFTADTAVSFPWREYDRSSDPAAATNSPKRQDVATSNGDSVLTYLDSVEEIRASRRRINSARGATLTRIVSGDFPPSGGSVAVVETSSPSPTVVPDSSQCHGDGDHGDEMLDASSQDVQFDSPEKDGVVMLLTRATRSSTSVFEGLRVRLSSDLCSPAVTGTSSSSTLTMDTGSTLTKHSAHQHSP